MRRFWWAALALLLLAVALWQQPGWLAAVGRAFRAETLSALAAHLRSFGIWTPLVSIALMVLQSVIAPLPGSLVTAANGVIFGVWQGALISWVGGMAGATVSYWLSRWLGRDLVVRWFGAASLARVDQLSGAHGFWLVLGARLVPLISFDFISYVAGISQLGFPRFIAATAVGMVPGTLAYSILGHDLALAQGSLLRVSLVLLAGLLVLLIGRAWLRRSFGSEPARHAAPGVPAGDAEDRENAG